MITYNELAKIKPIRCKAYLEYMKTVPPIVSWQGDTVYHHMDVRGGTMGSKASDIFCVALPHSLHQGFNDSIHTLGPEEFERLFNVDLKAHMLKNIEYYIANGGRFGR